MNPRRRKLLALLAAALCCGAFAPSAPAQDATPTPAPEPPVRVMILGTYHFGNPGLDLHDVKADDMLAPKRQEELADLAERLARFAPTKIAVEGAPKRADFTDADYEKFTPAALAKEANETMQIGYRLARQLGHKAVYAIDEQSKTVDYFPFDAVDEYAKAHGKGGFLDALNAEVGEDMQKVEAVQKNSPVRLALAAVNEPAGILDMHRRYYYSVLKLGDQQDQPGAVLNAMWYMRNAKIFAKLLQVARPGDRVVVVFGAGHAYWLRHFVENTPGYELAEPNGFLK